MDVRVNIEHIKHASLDMHDISKQISGVLPELEDVETQLKKQTEFASCLMALRKAREDIEVEKYKLNMLTQAVVNIGDWYRRTEEKIEDGFEIHKFDHVWIDIGNVDLSKVHEKLEMFYVGGEN